MFNFFKKPIVFHCYTDRAEVFNHAKIAKSSEFIPDWWKSIPKEVLANDDLVSLPTLKSCPGFIDLYRSGFFIPMWTDLMVEVGEFGNPAYRYQYADRRSEAMHHPTYQRGAAFPEEKYQHLKVSVPWYLKCDEDISFLFSTPTWNMDSPETFTVLPGMLNFKYQGAVNVNTLWTREAQLKRHLLPFGSPLAHLIPMTERKMVLQHHLLDTEEFENLRCIGRRVSFTTNYRKLKRVQEASGCPFHHTPEK
jgi:hypothetical protein